MYAPDVVEVLRFEPGTTRTSNSERTIKEYYLYPHNHTSSRTAMVCKGPTPVGPFTPINVNEDGTGIQSGSFIGIDPAVYVEYVDDPEDPDYQVGFRAYVYWGYYQAYAAELDQSTMWTKRPDGAYYDHFLPATSSNSGYGGVIDPAGTVYPLCPNEDIKQYNFFEGVSIRKVGNKYVVLWNGYSGSDYGLPDKITALRYAYGDTPLGPWKFGGVLVDPRAPEKGVTSSTLQATAWGFNTHGSLLEINDQWYVFYHRPPRGNMYARQSMVAPLTIKVDQASVADGGRVVIKGYSPDTDDNTWTVSDGTNTYTGAETTSSGFDIFGMDPYKYYSAGYACYFSNPSDNSLQDNFDIWDDHMPVTVSGNNKAIGFKYFGFSGLDEAKAAKKGLKPFEGNTPGSNTAFNLWLTPSTTNSFSIDVWVDGPSASVRGGTQLGTIHVPADSAQVPTKFTLNNADVNNLSGRRAIYLVTSSSNTKCTILGLGFSSDTKNIERPEMPTLGISVDGVDQTIPTTPIKSTNANGLTGYDTYWVSGSHPTSGLAKITATCSDPDIKILITQPSATSGVGSTGVVRFIKNGVVKKYNLFAETTTNNEQDDVDDILALNALMGDSKRITVSGSGLKTGTQKIPLANAYLDSLVGNLGVDYSVSYISDDQYMLTLSKGSTSMVVQPFYIDEIALGQDQKTVTADIGNTTDTSKSVRLIVAAYDKDGRMTEMVSSELVTIKPNGCTPFTVALTGDTTNKTVKAFIWDDQYIPYDQAWTLKKPT